MEPRNLTLLTDLYELTMMQGYFKEKDANSGRKMPTKPSFLMRSTAQTRMEMRFPSAPA